MEIYKIFRPKEWAALRDEGRTHGAPIDRSDGYIHLSTAHQVSETLSKHFADIPDLVICALDSDLMGDALKWEPSRGDALFPHLYRALGLNEIAWHETLIVRDGVHVLPARIR